MFGENSSYVTIFLYLNWTEATKIEWKLWKWHRYFEMSQLRCSTVVCICTFINADL
jgi:hypothetical protein